MISGRDMALNAPTSPYTASHLAVESSDGIAAYADPLSEERPERPLPIMGLIIQRYFTRPGVHPYDEVAWEKRLALIVGEDGHPVFEQRDVEFPQFWSQLATNVVASKYFRGPLGPPATASAEGVGRPVPLPPDTHPNGRPAPQPDCSAPR